MGKRAPTFNSPRLMLALLLVAVTGVRSGRNLLHAAHPRDPVRRFSGADKRLILARAGHRCERYGWLTGRCREINGLEADHVHPWPRGGWTHPDNGQALCRRHNKAKGATVPWNWQLRRLAERRTGYFPPEVATAVIRHRPRGSLHSAIATRPTSGRYEPGASSAP